MVIYSPVLQPIFQTTALSAGDLAISLGLSTVVFWAIELQKWFRSTAAAKGVSRNRFPTPDRSNRRMD